MREICCPRVARPLEKLGLRVTRESLVKSARYAMRYARSDHGQIGALRALNLANGALRASQHSLTEVCVIRFFSSLREKFVHAMCLVLSTVKSLKTFACGRRSECRGARPRFCAILSVNGLFQADGLLEAKRCFRRSAPTSPPSSTPLSAHEKELVTSFPTLCGRPPAPTGTAGSVHLRPELFAERRLPWCSRVFMV